MLKVDSAALKKLVRSVPDWPAQGVVFRDIMPLFQDALTLRALIDIFANRYFNQNIDIIAGIEARGFLLGPSIAYALGISFMPFRKKGKLPCLKREKEIISEDYELEYAKASLEAHKDACEPGQRVVIFDDLVATGETLLAAARILKKLGAELVEAAAIIDLPDLGGSQKLRATGIELYSLIEFEGE